MISSKLVLFCPGVTVAEGWNPPNVGNQGSTGSTSYNHHNPGNLRVSEYEAGNDGAFSIFNTDIEGFMALVRQWEMIATGKDTLYGDSLTIEGAVQKYTADALGSPELANYLTTLETMAGVKRSDYVSTIVG